MEKSLSLTFIFSIFWITNIVVLLLSYDIVNYIQIAKLLRGFSKELPKEELLGRSHGWLLWDSHRLEVGSR